MTPQSPAGYMCFRRSTVMGCRLACTDTGHRASRKRDRWLTRVGISGEAGRGRVEDDTKGEPSEGAATREATWRGLSWHAGVLTETSRKKHTAYRRSGDEVNRAC